MTKSKCGEADKEQTNINAPLHHINHLIRTWEVSLRGPLRGTPI